MEDFMKIVAETNQMNQKDRKDKLLSAIVRLSFVDTKIKNDHLQSFTEEYLIACFDDMKYQLWALLRPKLKFPTEFGDRPQNLLSPLEWNLLLKCISWPAATFQFQSKSVTLHPKHYSLRTSPSNHFVPVLCSFAITLKEEYNIDDSKSFYFFLIACCINGKSQEIETLRNTLVFGLGVPKNQVVNIGTWLQNQYYAVWNPKLDPNLMTSSGNTFLEWRTQYINEWNFLIRHLIIDIPDKTWEAKVPKHHVDLVMTLDPPSYKEKKTSTDNSKNNNNSDSSNENDDAEESEEKDDEDTNDDESMEDSNNVDDDDTTWADEEDIQKYMNSKFNLAPLRQISCRYQRIPQDVTTHKKMKQHRYFSKFFETAKAHAFDMPLDNILRLWMIAVFNPETRHDHLRQYFKEPKKVFHLLSQHHPLSEKPVKPEEWHEFMDLMYTPLDKIPRAGFDLYQIDDFNRSVDACAPRELDKASKISTRIKRFLAAYSRPCCWKSIWKHKWPLDKEIEQNIEDYRTKNPTIEPKTQQLLIYLVPKTPINTAY